MSTFLSPHFTLEEACFSPTAERLGIDNLCEDEEIIKTAKNTAINMEEVRTSLGNKIIHVNSWIRCLELNRILKSKDTSQHVKGEAVDFTCYDFGSPLDICKRLVYNSHIKFDQLILEHTWVHISFTQKPRLQVLSLLASRKYSIGLTDKYGKVL